LLINGPVEKVLAESPTPPRLKEQLQLLQICWRLPAKPEAGGRWPVSQICDLHGRMRLWNVEAAPEFSARTKAWWYPLVGSLEYRGHFRSATRARMRSAWRARGYDVYAGGVEAYSTLGWFKKTRS